MQLSGKQIENPLRGELAVLSFTQTGFLQFDNAKVQIHYIPDRDILTENVFSEWFSAFQKVDKPTTPEFVSNDMLASFYNEIMPFYIIMDIQIHHKNGLMQHIQTIKKQPNYKIPEELSSLIKTV